MYRSTTLCPTYYSSRQQRLKLRACPRYAYTAHQGLHIQQFVSSLRLFFHYTIPEIQHSTMQDFERFIPVVRLGLLINNAIGLLLAFSSIRRWNEPVFGLITTFAVSGGINVLFGALSFWSRSHKTASKDKRASKIVIAVTDGGLATAFLIMHILCIAIADNNWRFTSTVMLIYAACLGLVAW